MKADTMNEKTIELPPMPELPRGAHNMLMGDDWEDVYDASQMNAHYIAGFEAGRSRAASEPGEVARLAEMEARKDAAYLERNQVVAALAKCFPSGVARTAIEGWSQDWHGCVYIDLPTGQASWHFHDSQAYLFDGLPPYTGQWDGHDTPEKYRRLASMATRPASEAQAGWVMVPREPTAEMMLCGTEWVRNNYLVKECYRAMLTSSPLPASSPVAAEGQKAVAIFDDPRVQMVYDILCSDLEPPAGEHWEGWVARRIVTALATPTASMADAAEATCRHRIADARNPVVKDGYVCVDCGALFRAADHDSSTPGPRGENAGGVVEAWQPIATAPHGVRVLLGPRNAPVVGIVSHPPAWEEDRDPTCSVVHYNDFVFVAGYHCSEWMPLPPAPDRGLRIAEKGDAS